MPNRKLIKTASTRPRAVLVEDEPAVRRSLQLTLHAQGFDVRSYATAEAVLADASTQEAVCLITDYRLNDLDGIELTRRLRARGWDGKAILITAFPSADLMTRATEAGVFTILEKPFREGLLITTLQSCLSGVG